MRAATCLDAPWLGGQQRLVLRLVRGQRRGGHAVALQAHVKAALLHDYVRGKKKPRRRTLSASAHAAAGSTAESAPSTIWAAVTSAKRTLARPSVTVEARTAPGGKRARALSTLRTHAPHVMPSMTSSALDGGGARQPGASAAALGFGGATAARGAEPRTLGSTNKPSGSGISALAGAADGSLLPPKLGSAGTPSDDTAECAAAHASDAACAIGDRAAAGAGAGDAGRFCGADMRGP